jgi:hypothetical protein
MMAYTVYKYAKTPFESPVYMVHALQGLVNVAGGKTESQKALAILASCLEGRNR